MTKNTRIIFLIAVLVGIAASIQYLEKQKPMRFFSAPLGEVAINENHAPDLVSPQGFINSDPFRLADYFGKKIILIDFWTYSCINCQRTTPYLNAWHEKYADKGLLIVGVHTPEFEFEKKYENVVAAVQKFGIKYPVVQDNEYATWNNYRNRYWPHKFLIGIDGRIIYDHIGEGGYEETEKKIQEALAERMAALGMKDGILQNIEKPVGAVDVDFLKVKSPETYFGALRNKNFGSGAPYKTGAFTFPLEKVINPNTLYLVRSWNIADEYAENQSKGARVLFRYDAKDVYLVASALENVRIKIYRDGTLVKEVAGEDVSKDGSGIAIVREERLYRLIQGESYGSHLLEIEIESPGLRAFAFTFG